VDPLKPPKFAEIRGVIGGMGFALSAGLIGLGAGPRRLGRMNQNDAKKPQVGKADVAVTMVDRLLRYTRPIVIVGTVLVLCLAVLAMSWVLTKR
jgi:hypothetical protein